MIIAKLEIGKASKFKQRQFCKLANILNFKTKAISKLPEGHHLMLNLWLLRSPEVFVIQGSGLNLHAVSLKDDTGHLVFQN